jgi:hypothetical protein
MLVALPLCAVWLPHGATRSMASRLPNRRATSYCDQVGAAVLLEAASCGQALAARDLAGNAAVPIDLAVPGFGITDRLGRIFG